MKWFDFHSSLSRAPQVRFHSESYQKQSNKMTYWYACQWVTLRFVSSKIVRERTHGIAHRKFAFLWDDLTCNKMQKPVSQLKLTGFDTIWSRISREDRIRTCDPVVPNHVFYRAELPPEHLSGCCQPYLRLRYKTSAWQSFSGLSRRGRDSNPRYKFKLV